MGVKKLPTWATGQGHPQGVSPASEVQGRTRPRTRRRPRGQGQGQGQGRDRDRDRNRDRNRDRDAGRGSGGRESRHGRVDSKSNQALIVGVMYVCSAVLHILIVILANLAEAATSFIWQQLNVLIQHKKCFISKIEKSKINRKEEPGSSRQAEKK